MTTRLAYLVQPPFRIFVGLWGQAQQAWTEGTHGAAVGYLGGLSYDGRFWKDVTGVAFFTADLEGRRFVAGDAAGLTVFTVGVSGHGEVAPRLQWNLEPGLTWADGPNPFQPVQLPYGGMLPGDGPGLWTASLGLEWSLWGAEANLPLGVSFEPRIVGAGWVEAQGILAGWVWGCGARVRGRVGILGGLVASGEVTLDPVQGHLFWKLVLQNGGP